MLFRCLFCVKCVVIYRYNCQWFGCLFTNEEEFFVTWASEATFEGFLDKVKESKRKKMNEAGISSINLKYVETLT